MEEHDNDDAFASDIKPNDYHEVQIKEVTEGCDHLSPAQRDDLFKVLSKFKKLFSGKLGRFFSALAPLHSDNLLIIS
jgi:hypothetical protein